MERAAAAEPKAEPAKGTPSSPGTSPEHPATEAYDPSALPATTSGALV